jgi:hypothetical protein
MMHYQPYDETTIPEEEKLKKFNVAIFPNCKCAKSPYRKKATAPEKPKRELTYSEKLQLQGIPDIENEDDEFYLKGNYVYPYK